MIAALGRLYAAVIEYDWLANDTMDLAKHSSE